MRTEQQMLDLILETARGDERIRAVIMNGSRANPNAPRDPFQDFDIVFLVTNVDAFKYNFDWIKHFGEMMILQMPEDMQDPPAENKGYFVYLMQFMDGNRIDLGISPIAQIDDVRGDSLGILLLDKDGLFEPFPPSSEKDYLPTPPTAKAFADCCNEFWWVCPYVAKGLWRQEILYAKHMHEVYVKEQLMKMLRWHIGINTEFKINPGKMGKYFKKYLEPEVWELLQKTFADAGYDNTWDALTTTCDLFRRLAVPMAKQFEIEYPHGDDQRVSAYLEHIRFLPQDAKEIYS